MHEQPRAAATDMLPVLDAELRIGNAQVSALELALAARRWQGLVELELTQLARSAEWTGEARHSRTGNGPWPGSSSR